MNNYEYIIASLPEITTDWKFSDKRPEDYIEEIESLCSEKDQKTIAFLKEGLADENLNEDFYLRAASYPDRFIREYFLFDMNVRNTKVRYLNAALGRGADKDVMTLPAGEFEELTKLESVLADKDILARERGIDDLMWDKIGELTVFDYFNIDAILGFIAKLQIVARWFRLDEDSGRKMFRKLVDEVRGTFSGVKFDDINK